MTRVLIIDDEPLARSIVAEYLQHHPDFQVMQECKDGFEGVKSIQQHQPELIFLDIQMPKINGFEMLELLDQPPPVIFTTAHDEFAIKAFETHAVDYLLKPFSRERFDRAIQKFKSEINKQKPVNELLAATTQPEEQQRVVVKKGNNIVIVPIHQVLYMEAFDDYVKVHTKEGFYLKKKTMSHYEKLLEARQFVRVHRSYLLNLQELTRIEPLEKDSHVALLRNGERIPLSATGYARLKEVLGL
jgi:two-component system LytT family response regulator